MMMMRSHCPSGVETVNLAKSGHCSSEYETMTEVVKSDHCMDGHDTMIEVVKSDHCMRD